MKNIINGVELLKKINKGKAFYLISPFESIESEMVKTFENNYVIFNSFLKTPETIYVSDYLNENRSFYKAQGIDIDQAGVNSKIFELFFTKEIDNYDIFCINSAGLSYESIGQLSNFFFQTFKGIDSKTLFFIHIVDDLELKKNILKEIESETSTNIENILKEYKKPNRKKLKF